MLKVSQLAWLVWGLSPAGSGPFCEWQGAQEGGGCSVALKQLCGTGAREGHWCPEPLCRRVLCPSEPSQSLPEEQQWLMSLQSSGLVSWALVSFAHHPPTHTGPTYTYAHSHIHSHTDTLYYSYIHSSLPMMSPYMELSLLFHFSSRKTFASFIYSS